jgi:hypothetical protein
MIKYSFLFLLSWVFIVQSQYLNARIIISEVMTDNVSTIVDEDGETPDWIELHNAGVESIEIGGYFLTDDPADLNKWEIPSTELAPGAYHIIFASGKDRQRVAGNQHANFQLKNGGEFLALTLPDKFTVIDSFHPVVPQLDEDQSYGVKLINDKWVIHFFDTPTPKAANEGGTVGEQVDFSLAGRAFTDVLQLELSSRSGSPIYYTTNGTAPAVGNSTVYKTPISVDRTMIITAAIADGPHTQEVYFKVTPEFAEFSSDLPVVIMQADRIIRQDFGGMLIGILEPQQAGGRTTVKIPFSLTSRGHARTRGRSTQHFPKKSYRIEFQDAFGEDRILKPLGLPAESDWIISGRYEEDRSLIRNELIFELSNQIGRYAARTKFCELFVHSGSGPITMDDYVGAYSLMEVLKRDADRIDIEELLPSHIREPEVSGGYILKIDSAGPNDTELCIGGTTGGWGWNRCRNGQGILIVEPDRSELLTAQRDFITGYLEEMADSLGSSDATTGYPAFIDVESWIDIHLLNVLMLNVDALRLSAYYHKDRDGKLQAGPIWDFNISSGSRDRFGNPPRPSRSDVWRATSGDRGTDFFGGATQRWWVDLFRHRDFQQAYCDRWNDLRQDAFSTAKIHAIIERMADELREAQVRNQERWPEVPPEYGGWQGEIDHLKEWLAERGAWIDNELVAPPPERFSKSRNFGG